MHPHSSIVSACAWQWRESALRRRSPQRQPASSAAAMASAAVLLAPISSPLEPFPRTPAHPASTREIFEGFRAELDEHHDRRERLVKLSRDVTALSKKMSFLLHRSVVTPGAVAAELMRASVTQQRNPQGIISQAEAKNAEILDLLKQAAPDLQDGNMVRSPLFMAHTHASSGDICARSVPASRSGSRA